MYPLYLQTFQSSEHFQEVFTELVILKSVSQVAYMGSPVAIDSSVTKLPSTVSLN